MTSPRRDARRMGIAVAMAMMIPPLAAQAAGETIDCNVNRGNLCFQTGCDNASKSDRVSFDLAAGSMSYCTSRYDPSRCDAIPMQFTIQESSILGVSLEGSETAARAMFLNRNTGNLTLSRLAAGGIAAIDFGTCDIRR